MAYFSAGNNEYHDKYWLYGYTTIKGNKKVRNDEPICRFRARDGQAWQNSRIIINGNLTANKVFNGMIETDCKIKVEPNMYVRNSSGVYFKTLEIPSILKDKSQNTISSKPTVILQIRLMGTGG